MLEPPPSLLTFELTGVFRNIPLNLDHPIYPKCIPLLDPFPRPLSTPPLQVLTVDLIRLISLVIRYLCHLFRQPQPRAVINSYFKVYFLDFDRKHNVSTTFLDL